MAESEYSSPSMSWLAMSRAVPPSAALAMCSLGISSPVFADDVAADPDVLRATVVCESLAAPGRLRCDVEARGHTGALRWADVEVVRVAKFIAPLRGRAGPREAATREDELWRWSLGLVARARDTGDLTVRVRAVVCDRETCTPQVAFAVAHVTVGP
jgi:hypothetical protein